MLLSLSLKSEIKSDAFAYTLVFTDGYFSVVRTIFNLKRAIFSFGEHINPRISITFLFEPV